MYLFIFVFLCVLFVYGGMYFCFISCRASCFASFLFWLGFMLNMKIFDFVVVDSNGISIVYMMWKIIGVFMRYIRCNELV